MESLSRYRYNLGIEDARWIGHKNPARSFKRENPEDAPYFAGLDEGMRVTQWHGIVMRCEVRWDNPGFDTPRCLGHATHLGIAEYPGLTHVTCLCERHAKQAEECNRNAGKPNGFPYQWSIIPIEWA